MISMRSIGPIATCTLYELTQSSMDRSRPRSRRRILSPARLNDVIESVRRIAPDREHRSDSVRDSHRHGFVKVTVRKNVFVRSLQTVQLRHDDAERVDVPLRAAAPRLPLAAAQVFRCDPHVRRRLVVLVATVVTAVVPVDQIADLDSTFDVHVGSSFPRHSLASQL